MDDVPAILPTLFYMVFEYQDLRAALYETFGEKKSRGQFEVVSWSPHGDAQGLFADADFQRLLGRKIVVLAAKFAVVPLRNLC